MAKKGKRDDRSEQPETEETQLTENDGRDEEAASESGEKQEELSSETADESPPEKVDPVLDALAKFCVEQGLKDSSQIKKWHVPRDPETGKLYLVIDFYDNKGQYTRKRRDI